MYQGFLGLYSYTNLCFPKVSVHQAPVRAGEHGHQYVSWIQLNAPAAACRLR